ncbi:carboxypeptidase regulatory-like domain-containing protein [Polyangium sorediatum]|uniref:Carboxypeptidase regulatory-like domain-containing protein n=1 Tax=Polyangium sorediatum TaxID=889274 RepID=A0ABT6P9B4_9BACT|nr:carboxypeptidase regulatory-like domain-containing protein [Polyangium sorediatum]MDI1437203.1 carboxypeptidase regulatory-like domain-containing protein [Polyangium sorediatum]
MSTPPPAPKPSRYARLVALLATLVSLLYVAGLFDTRLSPFDLAMQAPALPAVLTTRDADVRVAIVDEHDRPLPGAVVRLFSIQGGTTYFAGEARAGEDGVASLEGMPRGETWLLAYAEGRARGSVRVVLGAGERVVRLVLQPAAAIDVVVVDEAEKPFPSAKITVTGGDPLPFVAMTGADGRARIDRLGQGPFSVRATARGYDDIVRTGVLPGPVPVRIKLERLGAFEVSVVEADGSPAPYARVLCAGAGLWPARSTVADANGVARIVGLRRGGYDLKAELGERVSATELGVELERAVTKPVKLVLGAGRRITVKVTDGESEDAPPVKEASVVLAEEGLSPFPIHGRTDAKGVVVLGPIALGYATVSARAPGFVPRSAVPVDDDATEVRVSLLRGGALVGEVVDDRGFPVGGATIEVVGVDIEGMPIDETSAMAEFRDDHFDLALPGPLPLLPIGELGVMPGPIPDLPRAGAFAATSLGGGDPWVTRADGEFRAEPIPPGRVHAIVRHPDYVEAESETVTIVSGGEARVKVVLHQGGSLEGRVVDADHRPVSGARVEIAAAAGTLERVTYTDDSGSFAFAAVPDEVLISVARPETPSDVAARLIVEIPDHERKEVEIVLPRQRDAVVVHVTDDRGYPLDRVEVRAVSLDPTVPLRRTFFTDDDGDVEIPDAAGLPLRFVLTRPSKAPRVEEVEIAPAKLTYELAEGITARGEVTGRDGRERIEGAEVVVYTDAGVRRARSDAEGAFEVKDLAPGRVRIVASHPDWATNEKIAAVAPAPSREVDLGAVDLVEAGEVEGTVIDPNDEPVAGARVAAGLVPTYLPLGPLPRGVVTTDREGHFKIVGVPEGDATIEAYSSDLGRASTNVKVRAGRSTSRVDITLPGEGSAKGEPKGAGSIALTLGERTERGAKVIVVVMVPPNGEAELAGVEPGDRLLKVNDREVRTIEDARRRISGPLAEDVVLTLAPDGDGEKPRRLRVRRERVRR